MICGDIVVCRDNGSIAGIYIAYDKKAVVGATIFGARIRSVKELYIQFKQVEVYSPREELSYARRKRLSEKLISLINGADKLSFRERLNFEKYIVWLYQDELKLELFEHPSYRPTVKNIIESNILEKRNG